MDIYVYNGKALQYNGKYISPKATGETWVLNDVLVITGTVVEFMEIGFTSNAKEWIAVSVDSGVVLYVGTKDNLEVYQEERQQRWLDQAYRIITFDAAPTGELLTWLQANGTKQ